MKARHLRLAPALALGLALLLPSARGGPVPGNRPERVEWFRDQGFGLFIHWSLDSQLGSVISHSLVGASGDYVARYLTELPMSFNPRKFHPGDWAALARLAGIRYVVFTAKHHSGFCMFETATTDFGIMRTPFARDATREILDAFRAEGIAPGLYFSPDDFLWLYQNGKRIDRNRPEVAPASNPGLMEYDRSQVRELLSHYGPIDVIFFDGPPEGLRELAWEMRPSIVVTRGAMETPEQHIPGMPVEGAWEACITMGTQWQYKPTNETYKPGGELIRLLIETRAKGGNLLLNVGPKPDGELPVEQEERLREIALWMFVNGEAIYGVRPWVITNEGPVWFTRSKGGEALYAIVFQTEPWRYGTWRELVLRSVAAGDATRISVLGQNDEVLEYRPEVVPRTTWQQRPDGLHIRAMRAQRLYNDRAWPNPVVLKITGARPAFAPPRVRTAGGRWTASGKTFVMEGELESLGQGGSVEAGFQYRPIGGFDVNVRATPWTDTGFLARQTPGRYSVEAGGLDPREQYEFRAVARHALVTVYGREMRVGPE